MLVFEREGAGAHVCLGKGLSHVCQLTSVCQAAVAALRGGARAHRLLCFGGVGVFGPGRRIHYRHVKAKRLLYKYCQLFVGDVGLRLH